MIVYFILTIFNNLSKVSINTSVTLSFAAVIELFYRLLTGFFNLDLFDVIFYIIYIFAVDVFRFNGGIFNNQKIIIKLKFELLFGLSRNLPNFTIVLHFSHCISIFKGLCFRHQHKVIYFNFPVVQYSSWRARMAMQLLNNAQW